jgi:hypothetical protein
MGYCFTQSRKRLNKEPNFETSLIKKGRPTDALFYWFNYFECSFLSVLEEDDLLSDLWECFFISGVAEGVGSGLG